MVLFLYFVICVFAIARGIFLHFKQFDLAIKSLAYMLIFLGVSLIVVFIHRLIGYVLDFYMGAHASFDHSLAQLYSLPPNAILRELWCVLVCAMFYIIGVTISTTGILLLINQRKLASDCFNLMILEISLAGLSMAICVGNAAETHARPSPDAHFSFRVYLGALGLTGWLRSRARALAQTGP